MVIAQREQRQRHAGLVVERADRRVGRAGAGQRRAGQLLGRGLARRAGDRDQARQRIVPAPALAMRAGDRRQRDARIVDLDHRGGAERTGVGATTARDHHGGGARGDGGPAERVAIEALAGDRDVQIAGRRDAAVDDHPAAHRVAVDAAAGAGGDGRGVEARAQRDRRDGLLAIVEVMLGRAEDLVVLVALAGDDHHVARRGLGQRGADRGAAIDVDHERRRHRRQDLIEDRPGILGARVVAGDHREIGAGRDHRAHERALAGIAIAAAAEHADEAPLRQRPQRAQQVVEGVGGVGVVDQHVEARVVVDALDPPRHAGHRRDAAGDGVVRHAEGLGDADRQREVGDVEVTDQHAGRDRELAARRAHVGAHAGHRRVLGDHADRRRGLRLRRGRVRRHRQHQPRLDRGRGRGAHRRAGRIIDVHHRDPVGREMPTEQQLLGLGVLVHRAVDVEVVLRQVRERRDRELEAGQAVHRQRRRRHLHHRVGHAVGDHLRERRVQHVRCRRGVRRVVALAVPAVVDRADHARVVAGRAQDRLDEIGRGGLAVGTGDADQRQPPRRMIGQRGDREAERASTIGDDQLRHREAVDRRLDRHRRRAALDRRRHEGVAVAATAAHRDEQRARRHRARVTGDRAHVEVGADQPGARDGADQFRELHADRRQRGGSSISSTGASSARSG